MLNPAHLRTLGAVVRAGSFTGAANELGYTASAVSQQMASLEHETHCVLFERHAHSITPTTAAVTLANQASAALALLDELEDDVRALAGGTLGRLRIGSFPTASERILPSSLVEISRALPRVNVELEEGEPDELLPRIMTRRIDLAFVYEYSLVPRSWPRGLDRRHVMDDELVLLVPNSMRVKSRLPLRDLRDATWVSTAVGTHGAGFLARLCGESGFVPTVNFRTNDYDVVREFVAAGLGVAVVPYLAWHDDPRVRTISLETATAVRHIYVVTRKVGANPTAQAAIAPILDTLGQSTGPEGKDLDL